MGLKKRATFVHIFANYWPIFNILPLTRLADSV